MPKIFISYRRADSEDLAQLVYDRLTQWGHIVFFDRQSLNAGRFANTIEKEIINANYLLVILTPTTLESEWVQKEIAVALKHRKEVIPLTDKGFRLNRSQLPADIQELADFDAIEYSREYPDAVFERIKRAIQINLPATTTKQPDTTMSAARLGLISAVLVAVIAGIFGIINTLLSQPSVTPTSTPTPPTVAVIVPSATPIPPTDTLPIPSETPVPLTATHTATDAPTLTATASATPTASFTPTASPTSTPTASPTSNGSPHLSLSARCEGQDAVFTIAHSGDPLTRALDYTILFDGVEVSSDKIERILVGGTRFEVGRWFSQRGALISLVVEATEGVVIDNNPVAIRCLEATPSATTTITTVSGYPCQVTVRLSVSGSSYRVLYILGSTNSHKTKVNDGEVVELLAPPEPYSGKLWSHIRFSSDNLDGYIEHDRLQPSICP